MRKENADPRRLGRGLLKAAPLLPALSVLSKAGYFGPTQDWATAIVVQPDGKIVLAGKAGTDFVVARYNADGTPDTGFGSGSVWSFACASSFS